MSSESAYRSGYVAIVGQPNVGKSTLLNALLGTKLSIVSAKPQTTRVAIRGILTDKNCQIIFVDTPGWLEPKDPAQSFMKKAVVQSIYDDADVIVWVIEPKPFGPAEVAFGEKLARIGKPLLVTINKTDVAGTSGVNKETENHVRKIFPSGVPLLKISAKTKAGLNELLQLIQTALPVTPAYFPADQLTDRWERFYVAELIREQVFGLYKEEVPHACAVVVEEFVEKAGRKDHIKAMLLVETEGQKKIMIGAGGAAIRQLGTAARGEIEKSLGRPVFLELVVKVHKNWRRDPEFLKNHF